MGHWQRHHIVPEGDQQVVLLPYSARHIAFVVQP
tara:strand:- start:42 stop:143 length:102 start_codon:yes stop_codon:yes gene_type:complete